MQKFRVFFNKIVQQASGETGEIEIVRYQVGKMAKPVQANFLLNTNLCKPSRQAETSFNKPMGEVRQLSVCKRSEQGAKSKTFAKQAG